MKSMADLIRAVSAGSISPSSPMLSIMVENSSSVMVGRSFCSGKSRFTTQPSPVSRAVRGVRRNMRTERGPEQTRA